MPWSNRWIGNPILTGHAQPALRHSRLRCALRHARSAPLRAAGASTFTRPEWSSPRRWCSRRSGASSPSSEIPIDYFARTGESKLSRFGDAWRHVRFMLLYSPSWLFFVPGFFLLLLGLAGMLVLASGPVDVFGRTWQIHTMLAFVALTLIGAQVVQLGVFARTYALTHFERARRAARARCGARIRLEHGLLLGARADPRRRRRRS